MKLVLAVVSAFVALSASAACDLLGFTQTRASAHVVVFQTPEGTPGIVNGNTIAVIGKDAVLVFDPGQFTTVGERVLAGIRRLTPAPVKYIVNSHWHGDHLLANSVYREAFPDAKIFAHSFTIEQAAKNLGPDYIARTKKGVDEAREFYAKKRATASEDERTWIDTTFECAAQYVPELDRTRVVLPDTAVDERLDLDLGELPVSIRHLGTGNTPGDLVLWVAADRLIATGDIVVHPAPYAIGSDLKPWPATIDAMLALGPAVIVPGHGPVMHDDRYVRDLRALLVGTQAQIESMQAKGVAKAQAAGKLDTAAFRARYIRTAMQRQAFEKFFEKSAVEAAWPKDAVAK